MWSDTWLRSQTGDHLRIGGDAVRVARRLLDPVQLDGHQGGGLPYGGGRAGLGRGRGCGGEQVVVGHGV